MVRQFSVPKLTRDSETMLNNPLDRGAGYKKLTNKKVTWSDVKNVEKLATGGHSCICTGTLDGEPVVVKFLRPEWEKNMAAIDEMDTEYDILSKLQHPNIVQLYGRGLISHGVPFLVMELLDGGTLSHALGFKSSFQKKKIKFSYSEILTYSHDLAEALNYIHERAIPNSLCIHRDLKPDNIGFTHDGKLKIIDFGLACVVDVSSASSDERYQMSGETGSFRYMAPEVAEHNPYNEKADVYSYGVILWEMMTKKKAYNNFTLNQFYKLVVKSGERPKIPKNWPTDFTCIIEECWSADIKKRPSFSEISGRLNSLRRANILLVPQLDCSLRSSLIRTFHKMNRRASA